MDPLVKLYSSLTIKQRAAIVATALLTGIGILGFVRFKRESDFRPLYTSMATEDAAVVVQKLRETAVDYRLSENGSSVLVPSAKLAETRLTLAAAGLPKTGHMGFELFDKTSFGATDFVEHINYKRALEGEIERSMMSLAEVEQARVHLTLSKESIFLDKQQPAKASIVLKLAPGARLSPNNVLAMTNLVASAVEGLAPNDVSIVDMNGNLLSKPKRSGDPDSAQVTSETLELRQQLERDLVAKIRSTLEPLLGTDRFRAGASVDCDLTSGEQQEETFDPSHSVMASSQKTEDVSERASAATGVPGTASNLPGAAVHTTSPGSGMSRRTENIAYQSSRIIKHTRIPQGVIRRMSLSVLLDHAVRWEGEGPARRRILEPPSPETIKTIKDLVAASTGFNSDRGDQLIVESLPFESSQSSEPQVSPAKPAVPPATPDPQWLVKLKKYQTVGAAAAGGVVLILVSFLILKRRRSQRAVTTDATLPAAAGKTPGLSPASTALQAVDNSAIDRVALSSQSEELAERVRRLAKQDVPLTANVLRLWLQEKGRPV